MDKEAERVFFYCLLDQLLPAMTPIAVIIMLAFVKC